MSRTIRRLLPLVVLAAAMLVIPSVSSAASTKTCKVSASKARKLGATYVTYATGKGGYKVRGTSCANGEKVVKAFHRCRKAASSGRCTTRVRGYSCTDKRPADLKGPFSFEGNVSCKSGTKRVIHHYQQDT